MASRSPLKPASAHAPQKFWHGALCEPPQALRMWFHHTTVLGLYIFANTYRVGALSIDWVVGHWSAPSTGERAYRASVLPLQRRSTFLYGWKRVYAQLIFLPAGQIRLHGVLYGYRRDRIQTIKQPIIRAPKE